MQLNIYIISHPLIQLLYNSIDNRTNSNISIYNHKYIGLILLYETMRKYVEIQTIYIKNINSIKTSYYKNPCEKHFIITNIVNTYHIISDIKTLIPEVKIIHIDSKKRNLSNIYKDNNLNLLNKKYKIIILYDILYDYNTINLIDDIIENTNISINNIQIACLACYSQLLNKIGSKYPTLNIYTTKIIN